MATSATKRRYADERFRDTCSGVRVQVNRESNPPVTLEERRLLVGLSDWPEREPFKGKPVFVVPAILARCLKGNTPC